MRTLYYLKLRFRETHHSEGTADPSVCPIPTFLDQEYTVLTKRSLLAAPSFSAHKPLPAPTKLADLRTKGGKYELTFKVPIRPVKTRVIDENVAL